MVAARRSLAHIGAMTRGLVVLRRDLPGGRIVIISLDERPDGVTGRLQVERRSDPARRNGEPPVVAEVTGATRDAVLAELRRVAGSDAELQRRFDAWREARPADTTVAAPGPAAGESGRRLRMPDGTWWAAERRHEITQLESALGTSHVRRLYMYFRGPGDTLRRAELSEGFPPADEADEAALRDVWRGAVELRPPAPGGAR
jgi:hypothetical protein